MECKEISLLLPEYSAGALDKEDRAFVEKHIHSCTGCKNELVEIEELGKVLTVGKEEDVQAPGGYFDELWPNLYKKIQAENLMPASNGKSRFARFIAFFSGFKTYQKASIPLVLILGTVLFYSVSSDEGGNRYSLFSRMTSSIFDDMDMGTPEPIEPGKVQNNNNTAATAGRTVAIDLNRILNSESRADLYNSVTDYVADMIVKISN